MLCLELMFRFRFYCLALLFALLFFALLEKATSDSASEIFSELDVAFFLLLAYGFEFIV